jgi:hypothetical protein
MPQDASRPSADQSQQHRADDRLQSQPDHSDATAEDKLSAHERQVHHRNKITHGPDNDGYTGVPPGEEGQYGMRRDGSTEPWYNDPNVGSHSADESDSRYSEWRASHPPANAEAGDGETARAKELEQWRREQTAPGTNVGSPVSNKPQGK